MKLQQIVEDLASALADVDASRVAHKSFQPGIGPYGEAAAIRESLGRLQALPDSPYASAAVRRTPDLLIPNAWAIEVKVIRPFGDNGKIAEHWSENVLHPYQGNTSSIGDCLKLASLEIPERKAILIYGFEHDPAIVPLEPAVMGFEILAREVAHVRIGERIETSRPNLVHPVHQVLRVYGFEVLGG